MRGFLSFVHAVFIGGLVMLLVDHDHYAAAAGVATTCITLLLWFIFDAIHEKI